VKRGEHGRCAEWGSGYPIPPYIPESVFQEFRRQLGALGFTPDQFGIGQNGVVGPNVIPLPTEGQLGGASGQSGSDTAHNSANQAIREFLNNVLCGCRGRLEPAGEQQTGDRNYA
jgi:hypothetical protein